VVYEIFALLVCYAVLIGSYSATLRDLQSVPSLKVKSLIGLLDPWR